MKKKPVFKDCTASYCYDGEFVGTDGLGNEFKNNVSSYGPGPPIVTGTPPTFWVFGMPEPRAGGWKPKA